MSLPPEGVFHIWRECAALKSPIVGLWMRGIYISSVTYEDGRLALVQTKTLPQFTGQFKLMGYGRGVMMDCLEELYPGATWCHDATRDEVAT